MVCLLGADDRRVGGDHEVDVRVGHQVGLELGHIDVEGTAESPQGLERRDDLGDDTLSGCTDVQARLAFPLESRMHTVNMRLACKLNELTAAEQQSEIEVHEMRMRSA